MSTTVKLSNIPLKPSAIPAEDEIIAAALAILETTSTWKQGKTFHKIVKTASRSKATGDGASWHYRASEHDAEEATFDELWNGLGVNKAENEKLYIAELTKVTKLKEISPTQSIWSLYNDLPPPLSTRVFTELQITRLSGESPSRVGLIVSIPIDLSSPEDAELAKLEDKAVKGAYVAVERITEHENGVSTWEMATSATPGGYIPTFFVESSMNGTIAEDVPRYLRWLHDDVRKKAPA